MCCSMQSGTSLWALRNCALPPPLVSETIWFAPFSCICVVVAGPALDKCACTSSPSRREPLHQCLPTFNATHRHAVVVPPSTNVWPRSTPPECGCTVRDEGCSCSARSNACGKAQSSARLMRHCTRSLMGMAPCAEQTSPCVCSWICATAHRVWRSMLAHQRSVHKQFASKTVAKRHHDAPIQELCHVGRSKVCIHPVHPPRVRGPSCAARFGAANSQRSSKVPACA